jgi:uncharacterized protein
MSQNKIAYVELPSTNVPTLKTFYGQLFGWTFEDFGDEYAAVHDAGLEAGFNGDPGSQSKAPLVIIEATDIQATFEQVKAAGGTITMPIYGYPGGKRFHFLDPSGNELAVFQPGA